MAEVLWACVEKKGVTGQGSPHFCEVLEVAVNEGLSGRGRKDDPGVVNGDLKLENVWQAKDLQTRFLDVWQGKDLAARFLDVWQGKDLRDFLAGRESGAMPEGVQEASSQTQTESIIIDTCCQDKSTGDGGDE